MYSSPAARGLLIPCCSAVVLLLGPEQGGRSNVVGNQPVGSGSTGAREGGHAFTVARSTDFLCPEITEPGYSGTLALGAAGPSKKPDLELGGYATKETQTRYFTA